MFRYVAAFLVLLAAAGLLGGIKASQIFAMIDAEAAFVPPPEFVSTARAEREMWTPRLRAVGTLVARQAVVVSTEVPGRVVRIDFESGETVRQGKILVELDTSVERAQLESAEAAAELAAVTLRRTRSLGKKNVRTQADLDGAESEHKRAKAAVGQIRASIAKKIIRAPFSGRLGIRQVDMGEIVNPGHALVSLQAVEDLYADFYLPQREVALVREGQTVRVSLDALKGQVFTGDVSAIEAAVDVATRNLLVRASVPNPELVLRPGMFVEVELELPGQGEVVTVPETAVLFAPYGDTVFVVEEGKVRQVLVELGERRGDFVAIVSGLEAGAEVVTAGAFKLRDGTAVVVDNERSIDPAVDPAPKDS